MRSRPRTHGPLAGSRDGRDGPVTIHQDADMYAALLGKDETAQFNAAGDAGVLLINPAPAA